MSKETEEGKKPMISMIISDETLNRHGFRIMTNGIDLTNFEKNPVCCLEHDTWRPPIGKWLNVRKEGDKLLGDLEFDPNDEQAMKVYNKYKDGYMNACSIHIRPTEKSDDESLLLPGQRYQTITKCELIEVSAVTIPAQAHAVKLSADAEGHEYKLSLITQKEENMEDSKENVALKATQEENKRLSAENEAMKQERVENLIALHQERGVIGAGEVESLKKLALADYSTVKEMLNARQKPSETSEQHAPTPKEEEGKRLSEQLSAMNQGGGASTQAKDDRADWTYLDWMKKDSEGLHLMEEKEPEKYAQLCASFNEESKKKGLVID